MTITRLDDDRFRVGGVTITRRDDGWAAIPDPLPHAAPRCSDDHDASQCLRLQRPLFVQPTLDEALNLAAAAILMFSPA
jgi:hypothetical protein